MYWDVQSPRTGMMYLTHQVYLLQAIYAATRFGIPDYLYEQPQTSAELAVKTGAHPETLHRVLRSMAGVGLIEEEHGVYSLNEWSNLLRKDAPESVYSFLRYVFDPWHWEVSGKMVETLSTGKTGYEIVDPQTTGIYEFMQQPGREDIFETFNNGVRAWSLIQHQAAIDSYDFGNEPMTIIDVGGGMASLLCMALQKNPQAQGINFDQPAMVEVSQSFIDKEHLSHRCETIGGNFFESVPADGDIYMVSSVLMDHGDEDVVTVLQHIRKAMKPTSKVLIIEALLGEGKFGYMVDMLELIETGQGKCRTLDEFRALLAQANMHITNVIRTDLPTIIEARA